MDRIDDLPVLDDEFADRYCELQQELAQLRRQSAPASKTPSLPDEKMLAELASVRENLQQALNRATAAEHAVQDWQGKYEAAAARVEELLATQKKLTVPVQPMRNAEATDGTELENLRQQLIELKEQRSRWKRLYEACRDEINGNS